MSIKTLEHIKRLNRRLVGLVENWEPVNQFALHPVLSSDNLFAVHP